MNQSSKFRTKNIGLKKNDKSLAAYNNNNENDNNNNIKFKASMIRTNLCDYSVGYILVKGTM